MTFDVLDQLPPADPLASENAMLSSIIDSLLSVDAAIAALQSRQVALLATALEIAQLQTSRLGDEKRRQREIPLRSIATEIGAALRASDRSVQRRLNDAWTLMFRFPATHTALAEGRITWAHVGVILDAGADIDDDKTRAGFEQAAIDRAHIESPGRLRGIIGTIAEAARPTSATERHRAARKKRGVFVRDLPDAMSELVAVGPTVLIHGIHDRLTAMAHEVRTAAMDAEKQAEKQAKEEAEKIAQEVAQNVPDGDAATADIPRDERTMDQLRADILIDMALGAAPTAAGDGLGRLRGHVQVTVPVLTLAGVRDGGADLAGVGPIDADTARRLVGEAPGFERVMTHPVTGAILAVDRYRTNADLRRLLDVRDEHCRMPGCLAPIWRTDIDHSHEAAAGGQTSDDNLGRLCRRHHVVKHARNWAIRHLGAGVLEWTSPAGRTYIDIPAPTLRFVSPAELPGEPPPPF